MSLAKISGLFRNAKDAELKYSSETAILKMNLVSSEKYKDVEKTCFIEATAFGKMAEILSQWAGAKGQQVFISGKLNMDRWEKDGVNHSKHTIIIEGFDFVAGQKDLSVPKDDFAPPSKTAAGVPVHYEQLAPVISYDDLPF